MQVLIPLNQSTHFISHRHRFTSGHMTQISQRVAALELLLEYLGNRHSHFLFPGVASCYMKECLSKKGARVERHSLSTLHAQRSLCLWIFHYVSW